MSTATAGGLTRAQIVDTFYQRIQTGQAPLLTPQDHQALATLLRDRLVAMAIQDSDTPNAIRALCEAEKVMLEQGFPRQHIQAELLPTYIRVLTTAIAQGQLPLTAQNSYPQLDTHTDGSVNRVDGRHYALDFLVYPSLPAVADKPDAEAVPSLPEPPEIDAASRQSVEDQGRSRAPEALSTQPVPPSPQLSSEDTAVASSPSATDIQRYLEELLAAHRHQAQMLAWATQRIEVLEQENAALRSAQSNAHPLPQLTAQLATARHKLYQIQALLAEEQTPLPQQDNLTGPPPSAPSDGAAPLIQTGAEPGQSASSILAAQPVASSLSSSPAVSPQGLSAAPPPQTAAGPKSAAQEQTGRGVVTEPDKKGITKTRKRTASTRATPTKSSAPRQVSKTPTKRTRRRTTGQQSPGAGSAARTEGGALARAERIFKGIQQWNRQHPEEAFAITASFLETKFNINRSAAQRFCETHQAAIQKMHNRLEVEPGRAKYFNRGKNIEAMVQFVDANG
jgi:hypothetical protein